MNILAALNKEKRVLEGKLNGILTAIKHLGGHEEKLKPKRRMSAKGRAAIAAAQRKRWAKVKKAK